MRQKKITDTSPGISDGGRVERYWMDKTVKEKSSQNIKFDNAVLKNGMIDQYELLKSYRLKGFEWGNWLNNNDRSDKLKAAAMSLRALSIVMRSNNLGFDGMVGIAFGACGNSKALAHFEPSTFMINITKDRGDGSLAHEYGHAIDYFFGMYIDQNSNYSSLVGGGTVAKMLKDNKGGQSRTIANGIVDSIITDNGKMSASYGRIKDHGEYWRRRNEIWARFFEQYVSHKLKKHGIHNPFLTHLKYENDCYLTPGDFNRVAPMMDAFVTVASRKMNEGGAGTRANVGNNKKTAAK